MTDPGDQPTAPMKDSEMLDEPGRIPSSVDGQPPTDSPVNQPAIRKSILGMSRRMFGILAAVTIAAIAAAGFGAYQYATKDRKAEQAKSACTSAVRDQLKSPSTARFSNLDAFISSTPESLTYRPAPDSLANLPDQTKYVVTGNIDSQNGFGAMVRSNFNCSAFYSSGVFKGTYVAFIEEGSGL